MGMVYERQLSIPAELKEMYPLTAEMSAVVSKRAEEIRDIFTGKDDRFLLIIGPCSADREDSVIDYISRLRKVADKVQDKIFNASNCGDNCAEWLLRIGQKKDVTVNLRHIMDFGDGEFEILVENTGEIVHNMKELLAVAGRYV